MNKKTVISLSAVLFAVLLNIAAAKYTKPVLPRSLLPGEKVVYSYQEFKNTLEENNGITSVYFGDNITMQIGGIKINPNKQYLTISGLNPLEPERTEPYTLTDYSSSSFYSTVYIDTAGIVSLTVCDMKITGKNFYGPFSIFDSESFSGVSLIYKRVDYNGPQFCYHRKGTIVIEDCTVKIHGQNGGSLNQEFSETKHLIFKGNTTILTESTNNSIFWHPLGGTFKLADNSMLNVISPNTSALYGVFYADLSIYNVDITIGEQAALNMTISGVFAPEAFVTLRSLIVREGGAFYLKSTKSVSAAVLRINGPLTAEKEASFIISGVSGGNNPLLKQEGGDITVMQGAVFHITGQNPYPSLLNLTGRAFICNDPASVLFYNANRTLTASSNPARININAQQINYWNTLSSGGLDALPLYKWDKPDGTDFFIDGTISAGTNGNFTDILSNYTAGDAPGKAPDNDTFNMETAHVLSFGRLELTVFESAVNSAAINGVTRPGATVRASFSQQGIDYTLPDVTADFTGIFHIPLDISLLTDTVIKVYCTWNYLTASADSTVQAGAGSLEFFVPETMEFLITEISSRIQTVRRLKTGWEIIVSDERDIGGWRLYARLDREITPDKTDLPPLHGAVIYVNNDGIKTVMTADTDILIASRAFSEDFSPVFWAEDKGILLSVKPGTAFTGTVYTAGIIWTLIDAP